MKKLLAFLTVIALLAASIVPMSAASQNVMPTCVDVVAIDCDKSGSKYVPFYMFDEYRAYDTNDKSTYCDFKMSSSKADVTAGISPKYNLAGETDKPDSIYLAAFIVELDKAYTVDHLRFSFQQGNKPSVTLDGFDILVSTDNTNWTKVHSVTELVCDKKFTTEVIEGFDTLIYSASFPAAEAKYVAFGLTQPRCQHADKLATMVDTATNEPLTANENTNYFRIAEFELFTVDPDAPVETTAAPVETTAAPVETTAAPVETTAAGTTAPTQAPDTADASMIVVAAAALALAVAVALRRRVCD